MTRLSAALRISVGWGENATLLACRTPKGKVRIAALAAEDTAGLCHHFDLTRLPGLWIAPP